MANAPFSSGRFAGGLLLVLAGVLGLPFDMRGQATPATTQTSTPAEPQLPTEIQAQLDKLQEALKAAQAAGDANAEAKALNAMGDVYVGVSAYQKASDDYNQALTQARAAKDAQQEAAALNGMGSCYRNQSQYTKAMEMHQQALDLAIPSGDVLGEAMALNGMGWVDDRLGQFQEALELQNRALPLAQKAGAKNLEGTILRRAGAVYLHQGENQKALERLEQARGIFREAGDRNGEAATLTGEGIVYWRLGEKRKALDTYNQALAIFRQAGDRGGEAATLQNEGILHWGFGEKQQGLDDYNQALAIYHQLGDRDGEAGTLTAIGLVYSDLGDEQKALEYQNQALPIFRQAGDRNGEARTLANIGRMYNDLGELGKALDAFNQALPVFRREGDRGSEATTLNFIGTLYSELGEEQKALDSYNQVLPVFRRIGDRVSGARTMLMIGEAYANLGKSARALGSLRQVLNEFRQIGDRDGESSALAWIGIVYNNLGNRQKALEYDNQAMRISRQAGERDFEGATLGLIGDVYSNQGDPKKALDSYNQALPLVTAANDPLMKADIFGALMRNRRKLEPALAIFYGKQAVNLLQQVRGNIKGLDKEMQKSFISSNEDFYHDLADLLVAQGRLPEAQQVLDLLKEQEYSDYTRGETANTLSPLTLTPAEKEAEEDYQKSTAQLVSLGEQWAELKKISSRTAEQEQQYQQLSGQLDAASKGLNDYYARLYVLFGKNSDANKQVADVKGDVSLLKQQIAKTPHTVALYTLVGKDRTSLIVITGTATVAREYAIPEADLNKKVADFEQVLRDPAKDPKPLAQALYKILFAPVKADLDQAQAETLVWSLDGVLRYVPMAALYDGKQYLVENYNTVTITPASIAHLAEKPDVSNLSATAMGISRKYEEGLTALPAVVGELDDVVKDAQVQGANGVLPGTILLNGQFTEKGMEAQLSGQHAVVHIASHFVFKPGDDSQSYLLLAGKDEGGGGISSDGGRFPRQPEAGA